MTELYIFDECVAYFELVRGGGTGNLAIQKETRTHGCSDLTLDPTLERWQIPA